MKAERNRERIVQTAMTLFAERGYAATSVGDIAQAAGLLKGNLAYYFKTKQALLQAVTEARGTALLAELSAGLGEASSALDAVERLLMHVASARAELARCGCPLGTLSGELGKDEPQLHAHAARPLTSLLGWLETQFGRALPTSAAAAAAEHLLSLLQGAAVLAHAQRDPDVIERQVRRARAWLRRELAVE